MKLQQGKFYLRVRDLRNLDDKEMRDVRGRKIGMIFQDPQTSLNPLMTIGAQLIETINKTINLYGSEATNKAVELLESVGIDEPEARLNLYPSSVLWRNAPARCDSFSACRRSRSYYCR